ncbi:MAG: helix-turn-helix transcriptional regulator [Nitrospiraceae bacterium]|nr:helix-turn-helix transcriptional regulator [Nitrospiraceae bacterium]
MFFGEGKGAQTPRGIFPWRELKGWTQAELAKRCGISATNTSLLENGKVEIGKRRAEQIAKAFGVHPAIIMFPEYEGNGIKKNAA